MIIMLSIHMYYVLVSNEEIVMTVQVNNNIRIRARLFLDSRTEHKSIFVDVSDYVVPDNIVDLMSHRYIKILEGIKEDKEYIDNSALLNVLGIARPQVVQGEQVITIPEDFNGVYDVPKGTLVLCANNAPGLTGITGGAPIIDITHCGIRGKVYIHTNTKQCSIRMCEYITGLEGYVWEVIMLVWTKVTN